MRSAVVLLLIVAGAVGVPAAPASSSKGKGSSGRAVKMPAAKVAVVPQTIPSSQYHAQDELGQYTYGYTSSDGQAKAEIKGIDGSIAGKYSYIDANGKRVEVSYVADEKGFRASGNHLPNGVPELPAYLAQAYQEANARLAQAYSSNKAKSGTSAEVSPSKASSAEVAKGAAPSHHSEKPSPPETKTKEESEGGGGQTSGETSGGGEETSGGGEETSGGGEETSGGAGSEEEEEGGEGGEGGAEEGEEEGGEEEEGEGSEAEGPHSKADKSEPASKQAVAPAGPAPGASSVAPQPTSGIFYRLPQVSPYGGAQFAFVSSGNPGQYVHFTQVQGPAQAPAFAGRPAPAAVAVAPAPAAVVARPVQVAVQPIKQPQQQFLVQQPAMVRFIAVPQQHIQPQQIQQQQRQPHQIHQQQIQPQQIQPQQIQPQQIQPQHIQPQHIQPQQIQPQQVYKFSHFAQVPSSAGGAVAVAGQPQIASRISQAPYF